MDKKRVAVIFGGQSSEHEVSRISAESVLKTIDRDKYDIVVIGITKAGRWLSYDGPIEKISTGEWESLALESAKIKSLPTWPAQGPKDRNTEPAQISARNIFRSSGAEAGGEKIDIVFPVLHGINGEDGTIQGLFEMADIPYVGCGVLGSALGMDKVYAKIVFEKAGIPQGKYLSFTRKQLNRELEACINRVEDYLSYPCFIKPSNAGSSVGVSKAVDRSSLMEALKLASDYDRRILVEEFIDGREVECAVLGNDDPEASTVGEVVPCNEFYDYKAKYIDNSSEIIIPANLPEKTIQEIREYAVKAFTALDCAGLSRVDFFVQRGSGRVYINEVNTLPGFTSISMYPKLWEKSGIPYRELIDRLIELGLERFEESRRKID